MIDAGSEIAFGFMMALIGYVSTYVPKWQAKLTLDGLALIFLPFTLIGSVLTAKDIGDWNTAVQLYAEYEVSGMLGDLGGSIFNKIQSTVFEIASSILGR